MTKHANLYLSLVAEVLMIVHLACQERICSDSQGLIQKEVPCSTANGNTLYRTSQQLIVHHALHSESLLHSLQESQRVLAFRQITNHTRTSLNCVRLRADAYSHLSRLQKHHIHQPQSLSHHVVDAIHSSIQISVSRIDGNVVLQSQTDTALHRIVVSQMLQGMEDKRMMRHNQIASQPHRFLDYLFGHVQAQ